MGDSWTALHHDDHVAVVTFIWVFPDGEVIELLPLLSTRGSGFSPLPPGRWLLFQTDSLDIPPRGYEILRKHDHKYAVTAVVKSMGLQSNTVVMNGCRLPGRYRPLDHSRFAPAKDKVRDAALDALLHLAFRKRGKK
ncbi:MAG: hypothetical protein K2W96_00560 [Gemmataceae bacterium]|nr:hypothetical protein [Gemmataceae bacterium]